MAVGLILVYSCRNSSGVSPDSLSNSGAKVLLFSDMTKEKLRYLRKIPNNDYKKNSRMDVVCPCGSDDISAV